MAAVRENHRQDRTAEATQAEAGKGKSDEMTTQRLSGAGGSASSAYLVSVQAAGFPIVISADCQVLPPRSVESSSAASHTSGHELEEGCFLPSSQVP